MYQIKKAFDLVVNQIDEMVRRNEDDLGSGAAKDYAEYRERCGVITGLLTARRSITDLTKNMEESDE